MRFLLSLDLNQRLRLPLAAQAGSFHIDYRDGGQVQYAELLWVLLREGV